MNFQVDDAKGYQTDNGDLFIEPETESIRWLPFGLLSALLVLLVLLWLMTLGAIIGNLGFMTIITGILKMVVLTPLVLGFGYSMLLQWRGLRRPTVRVSSRVERLDILWPSAIRRIPFEAITGLHVLNAAETGPLLEYERRLFSLLRLQRYRVGALLKHGEIVWLCSITGKDAQNQANSVGQLLLDMLDTTKPSA